MFSYQGYSVLSVSLFFSVMTYQSLGLVGVLTLSGLNLPLSSHPLQVENCGSDSRLVVDEDDLEWVKN